MVLELQSLNDSDGDGFLDRFDSQPINDTDTDLDGMPDTWERKHFLDALKDDSELDLDGDHATNIFEYQSGTEPNNANSVPLLPKVGADFDDPHH